MTELLIVFAILGMVAASVFWVSTVSQQTYTRAASLEDAQLGARAGLDRMADELRLIGAYWSGATDATDAITAASATSITFKGDVDADTVSSSGNEITLQSAAAATATSVTVDQATGIVAGEYVYLADGTIREVKQVSSVNGTTINLATGLTNIYLAGSMVRSVETVAYTYDSGASTLTRTVGGGSAETIVDNVTGLTLTYYDANGNSLGSSPALSAIREIQASLTTKGSDGGRRTMSSRVRPRSLGLQ